MGNVYHENIPVAQCHEIDVDKAALGTLAVGRGGTGFATYDKGDILYSDSNNSFAKLSASSTDGLVLSMTSSTPAWTLPSSLTIALENLSDVSISSSASDDILTYDGTNWINHNAIKGILLSNLIDKTVAETISGAWDFTGASNIAFAASDKTIGGIQVTNLLDKTANEYISGSWEFQGDISFNNGTVEIAGIENQNLVDKTAAETISGVWTHSAKIVPSAANIDFGANSSASAWEYGYFHNIRVDSIAIATGFAGSNLEILNPLHVQPTDSGASKEVLRFNRISASPTTADKDMIAFYYYNASFESTKYGEISFQYDDVTKGSENGAIILRVVNGGTMLDGIEIDKYGFQIHKGFTGTSGTADGSVRITSGTWKGTSTCLAISASEGSSSSAGFNTENLNYLMPVVYNGTEYQIPLYKP